MQAILGRIHEVGGEVVAVSISRPEVLAAHLRLVPRPFPVVADPDLKVYRAFGLERGTWTMFLNPRVLARYLWLLLGGWGLRWPNTGEDLMQLGGDFVLDAERRIVFAHRSGDPADGPAVADLLGAVVRAAGRGS